MSEQVETIIVGGGQAGLSLSYHLTQAGRENLVLEKAAKVGDAWRTQRWDSFTLVTPNWSFKLPGAEYDGLDPHGYMARSEIVERFDGMVERNRLPVKCSTVVTSIEPVEEGQKGYIVRTEDGIYRAKNVVIATGVYHQPNIPPFAAATPGHIRQMTSIQYKNPGMIADGAVLVVGSGQSGAQITEELNQAGRKVYLCVGSTAHSQRRYRGRDIYEWMMLTGFLNRSAEQLPGPKGKPFSPPLLTGKAGGHALNLHQFYRDGVTLLGHLQGVENGCLIVTPDLYERLSKSDEFEANQLQMIDAFIEKSGIATERAEPFEQRRDGYAAPVITSLDLQQAGIQTIIWAGGYRSDFRMVKVPEVFSPIGLPISQGGATRASGLYFIGLPLADPIKTALLLGVGDFTAQVAARL